MVIADAEESRQAAAYCAEQAESQDPDRWATVLMAPEAARPALAALLAFNLEIARVREATTEPTVGLMRLQWWRDAIEEIYEGQPRRHNVVTLLHEAVRAHDLPREIFDRMIDAREADLEDEPPATRADLLLYADRTSGDLHRLMAGALGASRASDVAGAAGRAWAVTGLIRALPFLMARGRPPVPREVLDELGVELSALRGRKGAAEDRRRVVQRMIGLAESELDQVTALRRTVPAEARAAVLVAPLARGYLNRLAKLDADAWDARLTLPLASRGWRLLLGRWGRL